MTKRIKHLVCALALGLLGSALWAPPAQAADELCPYLKLLGKRYSACVPLP